VRSGTAHVPNGSDPSSQDASLHQSHHKRQHHHQKHHRNIGEKGVEEEVHGFVKEYTSPIAEDVRSDKAHVPNGSDPSAHGASLHQAHSRKHHGKGHKTRDVAERGMEEEVHGFVTEYLPPLNEWERRDTPYDANGSDPSAHDASLHQTGHKKHHSHHKHDVAERKMEEEVHGFTSEYTSPVNEIPRSEHAYPKNGANAASLHQHKRKHQKHHHHGKHHKNIGKDGIDGQVQGWTSSQNVIESLPGVKVPTAYDPNGSAPESHAQTLAQGGNIAEPSLSDYVHGLTSGLNVVEALP